jgi:hypothetical protein
VIKAFCDWCGAELRTKALKANEAHAPALHEELVLAGIDTQAKVTVDVKVTVGDGQHICARCSARAVAMASSYLEGPEGPPYDVEAEPAAVPAEEPA